MKPGVRSIQYAAASSFADFSQLPAGCSIRLSDFLTGSLQNLPFTQDSAHVSEKWSYDENGRSCDFSLTAALRADKDSWRPVLRKMTGKKCIFVITLINGESYVIGSRQYLPTFTFEDGISGVSSDGFTFLISHQSLQGPVMLSQ
ncbi:MAG: hypothetical protein J6O51_00915 [Bacteroidales bacterium]|nr:hypothetical protein [Bacteroidales bacterium]